MSKDYQARWVRWMTAYSCGYGAGVAVGTGSWWWMLLWLTIPLGALAEVAIERSK